MEYSVEIIFGKEQVIKYRQGQNLTDYENLVNKKLYKFKSLNERNAFYKGLSEADGWITFEIIKEFKTNLSIEEKPIFNYWQFIEKYYPNYCTSDEILMSDILSRKLKGEEICKSDEDYIKNWNVRKELKKLDKKLLGKAFDNFFDSIYPKEDNF